ncbi:strictosidine synthase related protein [Nitzschia inconspicua]|uniref:Strictosidine synthase related protein n=1 Tax=Nitzschia inconspicua TaxID=303405 RepID=A0A9K3PSX3_9STRA|nr:strictosidine synthase related protein [Nitzschia inconspicua]
MFPLFRLGVVLPGCLLLVMWTSRDFFGTRLFPYGVPQRITDRPTFGRVDASNDSLRLKHGKLRKIYERRIDHTAPRLLSSPETVFFGPDGTMYTATDQGHLISLTDWKYESNHIITAKTTLVKSLGPGRPLGAKFTSDGSTIYFADALLGLLRLRHPHNPESKVEIVASTVVDTNGQSTPIMLADDLTIGPVSGKIYFTDASTVPPPRNGDMTYDPMYASKVDALKAAPSGRLLEYDPSTDTVRILATDLWFANGVGVDQDEQYLVFAETFRLGLAKYYLKGKQKGEIEYIVRGSPSPAYFDGVDCAWKGVTATTSHCFAANPSSVILAARILLSLPHPIDWILRTLLIMLPKEWLPKTTHYGGITVVDPTTSSYIALIQDPTGEDVGHITGVTIHDNKVFLGSLENNYIGVYDLS